MTNDELSAKVAEARGEVKLIQTTFENKENGLYYLPIDELEHHKRWVEPDGTETIFADAYRKVKPYAKDMNAAWGLVEEMENDGNFVMTRSFCGCGRRVDVSADKFAPDFEFSGADTTMPRAICRAYLAFKGVK